MLPTEVADPFMQQALDFWIHPEIERRRQDGRLPADAGLYAVQVIFNRDAPIEVRLNGEVRAEATVKFKGSMSPGQDVMTSDLEDIETIDLTDHDPNAGHITMIYIPDRWVVRFDFRYNAAHATQHVEAAREFLGCASFALESEFLRAFVENMLAAAELLAKGVLILHDDDLLHARSHNMVTARFNKWGHLGNTDTRYTRQLNRLWRLRSSARYLNSDFDLSQEEAQAMLGVAHEMLASVEERVPLRSKASYDGLDSSHDGEAQAS